MRTRPTRVPRLTHVAGASACSSPKCRTQLRVCRFTSYPDQQDGDVYPNPYGYINALYIGLNFVCVALPALGVLQRDAAQRHGMPHIAEVPVGTAAAGRRH